MKSIVVYVDCIRLNLGPFQTPFILGAAHVRFHDVLDIGETAHDVTDKAA